jgi:uncharacterized alpha-E superfamily protein
MISRVAQASFWLQRYLERMESAARLLYVTASGGPIAATQGKGRWTPLLTICGEYPAFVSLHGTAALDDSSCVLEYLTFSLDCPVSIASSLSMARENARQIRETISREAWETINRVWLWLQSAEARELFVDDPLGFFRHMRDAGHQCRGAIVATMPEDEPLHFMTLGMYLERANQTARLVDVHHHTIDGDSDAAPVTAPVGQTNDSVDELAIWVQVLLGCGAYETFFKRNRKTLRGYRVARFLLVDPALPRSVLHCIRKAASEIESIAALSGDQRILSSRSELHALWRRLDVLEVKTLTPDDIHNELTAIIDGLDRVCVCLGSDFFAPPAPWRYHSSTTQ